MSQLVITDLNFCKSEFPSQAEVKGGFFAVAFGWDAKFAFELDGQAAVGGGFAYAISVGDNPVATAGGGVGIF